MTTDVRHEIKQGLAKVTKKQLELFIRLYSHPALGLDIDTIVDNIAVYKLEWALRQILNTLHRKKS